MPKEFKQFGFHKYEHDFWRKSFVFEVPPGGTVKSEKFPEDIYLWGGIYIAQVVPNGFKEFEDFATFEVVDEDNLLGYGAGAVLSNFVEDEFFDDAGRGMVESRDASTLFKGLYLRITCTHGGTAPYKFIMRYLMRR